MPQNITRVFTTWTCVRCTLTETVEKPAVGTPRTREFALGHTISLHIGLTDYQGAVVGGSDTSGDLCNGCGEAMHKALKEVKP
jgi:hypothetical protein